MNQKPNILLFVPDALRGKVLAPGHICQTPNIDRLSKQGMRFSRAYSTSPVCSPSRASFMTGLLPHNHGVLQVKHCVDSDQSMLRSDKVHFAQRLQEAGYHTGYFGKWHIERSGQLNHFGWQNYLCEMNENFHNSFSDIVKPDSENFYPELQRWQTGPEGYKPILQYAVTDIPSPQRPVAVPTRLATQFLNHAMRRSAPWCLCVSYGDPNEQLVCGSDVFEKYDLDSIDLPENLYDDLADRPNIYRRVRESWNDMSEYDWKMIRACYYARVTEIDRELGTILDTIEKADQLQNTIIIVTSDHGRYLGSHGMMAHQFGAFEELYDIPLIVKAPSVCGNYASKGRVSLHDLCPTLLDLAEVPFAEVPDSQSFAELLNNPAGNENRFTEGYAEYHGTRFPMAQRVYWDDEWKYVFNGFDYDELYHLGADPGEMKNRVWDPEQSERIKYMQRQIWNRIKGTGDTSLENTHYYSMRFAQVGPYED